MTDYQLKNFSAAKITTTKADGKRSFTAVISTSDVDHEKDVLLPQGCISKGYETNPVVIWNHDTDIPAIGRCISIDREDKQLVATAEMAEGTELSDTIWKLMQQGIIRGVSVGFEPMEKRNPTQKDKEMFGEDVGRVFSKWELYEFSIVNLPCNQNALIMEVGKAIKKGIVSEVEAKGLLGDVEFPDLSEMEIEEEKETIKEPVITVLINEKPKPKQKPKRKIIIVRKKVLRTPIDIDGMIKEEIARRKGKFFAD